MKLRPRISELWHQTAHLLIRSRTALVALLAQASSSISSLVVSIWLVLIAPKEAFGNYSILFSFAVVGAGVASSALTIQFVVHQPGKTPDEIAVSHCDYQAATAIACLMLLAAGTAIAASVSFNASILQPASIASVVGMLWAMASRELMTRYLIFVDKRRLIVRSSGVLLVVTPALLVLAPQSGNLVQWASISYVAASLLSVLAGTIGAGGPSAPLSISRIADTFRESWSGGKWGIVSNAFFALRNQAHTFLLAPWGAAVVADVNIARLAFMPIFQLVPVISQIGLGSAAKLRARSFAAVRTAGRRLVIIAAAPVVLYGLAAILSAHYFPLGELYPEYTHAIVYLPGWCLLTAIIAVRVGYSTTLQALHDFRGVASGNALSVVALFAAWFLLKDTFGTPTALYAMAASEAVVIVAYATRIDRLQRDA